MVFVALSMLFFANSAKAEDDCYWACDELPPPDPAHCFWHPAGCLPKPPFPPVGNRPPVAVDDGPAGIGALIGGTGLSGLSMTTKGFDTLDKLPGYDGDDDDPYTVEVNSENNPLPVLANDYDPDKDPISIVGVSFLSGGRTGDITTGMIANVLYYTPEPGFTGYDMFTYTIQDSYGQTDSATVVVYVFDTGNPPVAETDRLTVTDRSQTYIIDVMINDYDIDGDRPILCPFECASEAGECYSAQYGLPQAIFDDPRYPDGVVYYTPTVPQGFVGVDQFKYKITDMHGHTTKGWVIVTYPAPSNTAPKANDDNDYMVYKDKTLTVIAPGVLLGDTDDDGDSLTAILVSGPSAGGMLSLNSDGSFTYTPKTGFTGMDRFTYKANDGTEDSNEAQVNIEVREPPAGQVLQPILETQVSSCYSEIQYNFRIELTLQGSPTINSIVYHIDWGDRVEVLPPTTDLILTWRHVWVTAGINDVKVYADVNCIPGPVMTDWSKPLPVIIQHKSEVPI